MAVTPTNGYCNGDQLKAALSIADTADDAALTRAIDTASRAIDDFCGRRFYEDAADTTRYFTAREWGRVVLHGPPTAVDLVSVTTVEVDYTGNGTYGTTWTVNNDFVLGPRSADVDGRPFSELTVLPQSRWAPKDIRDAVKVTGTFGWPTAAPVKVVEATLIQASRIYKRVREAPFGIASLTIDGGGMRLLSRLDNDVELLVRPYRIHHRLGIL